MNTPKYKFGDRMYLIVKRERYVRNKYKDCSECENTRKVVYTDGSGIEHSIVCPVCKLKELSSPVWEWVVHSHTTDTVKEPTIKSIIFTENFGITYSSRILDSYTGIGIWGNEEDIFTDLEEAKEECERRNKELWEK